MPALIRLAKSKRITPVLGFRKGKWAIHGDISIKAPDLWRGLFWDVHRMWWRDEEEGGVAAWYVTPPFWHANKPSDGLSIECWICVVPCLPIRVMFWIPTRGR